ncbi:MAG: DUF2092 domain-containing protein [Phycisphaerales bacterium]|nr:MAG: DUF2092 domain-containing protein [Phycisphaerales bacterium]
MRKRRNNTVGQARSWQMAVIAAAALLGSVVPEAGQVVAAMSLQEREPEKAAPGQTTDEDQIDSKAAAELKKMTTYLDSREKIIFKIQTTWEAIQDSGMKLQFETKQEIGIQRPNRAYWSTIRNDGKAWRAWYDGNTLTHLDVDENTYVQLSVPGTLNEMLDFVLETFDLPTPPMLDFLYSDTETSFLSEIKRAVYVGECIQNGKKCYHLAFSKAEVDFQIWIPTDGKPLPVKYSITWTKEPLLPWFVADFLEWNTEPAFADGSFTAIMPTGAKRREEPRRVDDDE